MGAIISPIYGFTAQSFADVVNNTLTSNSVNLGANFTFVQKYLGAGTVAGGSTVRISVIAHSSNSTIIGSMWIGLPKTFGTPAYDFASAPTRVTFGGANGITVASGTTIDSDDISLAFNIGGGGPSFMIATDITNSRIKFGTGFGSNYISYAASGVSEASSTSKAGTYTSTNGASGRINFITRIQAK